MVLKKLEAKLPFIPTYRFEEDDDILIWWFERAFSQAQYGQHAAYGTNSCTVIAILVAEMIAKYKIETSTVQRRFPRDTVIGFALAILYANSSYARLSISGQLTDANLSIPEAIKAAENHLENITEWFYVHVKVPNNKVYAKTATEKIIKVIHNGIEMWKNVSFRKDYIFVVMIADNRSVVLCFQDNKQCITFFDSHYHSPNYGAVIAQTKWSNLSTLVAWIVEMFKNIYRSKPDIYELSFIPIKSRE